MDQNRSQDLVRFLSLTCLLRALTDFCFLGFISEIRRDLSMNMVLSCVALAATVGRSVSANIAST